MAEAICTTIAVAASKNEREIVLLQLDEARRGHDRSPRLGVEVCPVAPALPALFIPPVRVRAEKDASGAERGPELPEDARQLLGRDVEQRCVREHAMEARRGEVEGEEVLVQHLAAGAV